MLAPSFYRTDFVGSCSHDDPALIISEVAKNTPRQASLLSGGTWQRVPHKKEPSSLAMLGCLSHLPLRLLPKVVTEVSLLSNLAPKPNKAPVAWIPRTKEETEKAYLDKALNLSREKHLPLAFCQGSGNDVGLVGGDASSFQSAGNYKGTWQLFDAPTFYLCSKTFVGLTWKSCPENEARENLALWFGRFVPGHRTRPARDLSVIRTTTCASLLLRLIYKPRGAGPSVWISGPPKRWTLD